MPEPQAIFPQYQTASWKPDGGKEVKFPVASITEEFANRVPRHRRIRRRGARLDCTGSDAREWHIVVAHYNDPDQEPGIGDGNAQYPDTVNALCDSFDVEETGELVTPTRGKRRCKAWRYTRQETAEERDVALVTYIWVEDAEDDASAASSTAPSASSAAKPAAESADFQLATQGANSNSFGDTMDDLQGLAEAPGTFVNDMDAKVNGMVGQVEAVEKAFAVEGSKAANEVQLLLTNPEASHAGRALRLVSDTASKMPLEKAIGGALGVGPATKTVRFHTWVSIFDVATRYGQNSADLMLLNAGMPNHLAIPPGTPILIYDE